MIKGNKYKNSFKSYLSRINLIFGLNKIEIGYQIRFLLWKKIKNEMN